MHASLCLLSLEPVLFLLLEIDISFITLYQAEL